MLIIENYGQLGDQYIVGPPT